jgi:hypothetical protein
LEKEHYERRPADFVFLVFFGWSLLLPLGLFMGLPILSYSLMAYIVYIACNLSPEREIGLFMIRLIFLIFNLKSNSSKRLLLSMGFVVVTYVDGC